MGVMVVVAHKILETALSPNSPFFFWDLHFVLGLGLIIIQGSDNFKVRY